MKERAELKVVSADRIAYKWVVTVAMVRPTPRPGFIPSSVVEHSPNRDGLIVILDTRGFGCDYALSKLTLGPRTAGETKTT